MVRYLPYRCEKCGADLRARLGCYDALLVYAPPSVVNKRPEQTNPSTKPPIFLSSWLSPNQHADMARERRNAPVAVPLLRPMEHNAIARAETAAQRHRVQCSDLLSRFRSLHVTNTNDTGEVIDGDSDSSDVFQDALEEQKPPMPSHQSPSALPSAPSSDSDDCQPTTSRRRLLVKSFDRSDDVTVPEATSETPWKRLKRRAAATTLSGPGDTGNTSSSLWQDHTPISHRASSAEEEMSDGLRSFIVDDSDIDSLAEVNTIDSVPGEGSRTRTGRTPPVKSPPRKLISPSKRGFRIPTPPGRPSGDIFWNPAHINDWNDRHSPIKPLESPRKQRPTTMSPKSRCEATKTKAASRKAFEQVKAQIARNFLEELDTKITNHKIAELTAATGGTTITWSKTLKKTAGRAKVTTRCERKPCEHIGVTSAKTYPQHASIELAEKVIDDEHRLRNTLAHEFCHLANILVSNIKKEPHGPSFRAWGAKVTAQFEDITVTRCHSYQIDYKYIWRCANPLCAQDYKRHSKSIDPSRQKCGICRAHLEQIQPRPRSRRAGGISAAQQSETGGSQVPKTPEKPAVNGYAAFVQEHFAAVKRDLPPRSPHKLVMQTLGARYKKSKAAAVPALAFPPVSVGQAYSETERSVSASLGGKGDSAGHAILIG